MTRYPCLARVTEERRLGQRSEDRRSEGRVLAAYIEGISLGRSTTRGNKMATESSDTLLNLYVFRP